jgi:hypothetical protein
VEATLWVREESPDRQREIAREFGEVVISCLPAGMWESLLAAPVKPPWRAIPQRQQVGEPGTLFGLLVAGHRKGFRQALLRKREVGWVGDWRGDAVAFRFQSPPVEPVMLIFT